MSKADLEKVFQMFPEEYRAWGVFYHQICLAMAITVRVSPSIEYIFYTADDLAFRRFSPVVMLHQGIFSQCLQEGVEILDLGTSSLKGNINQGVFNFKRNLGASLGWKSTFRKEFKSGF
jgi:lipid II:glycine glycyltransferase (peptidoglycan interpeptide bridge formation enzyme)